MAGTKLDIGAVMEGALKDKVNVLDPKALKEYAAQLKDVDPKVADAIKGLDGKSKDTIADLSRSLETDVGAAILDKVKALPDAAQKAIGEHWKNLTESPGLTLRGLWNSFTDSLKGNGPGAKVAQFLTLAATGGTGLTAVAAIDRVVRDTGANGQVKILGTKPQQAQAAMVEARKLGVDRLKNEAGVVSQGALEMVEAGGNAVSDLVGRLAGTHVGVDVNGKTVTVRKATRSDMDTGSADIQAEIDRPAPAAAAPAAVAAAPVAPAAPATAAASSSSLVGAASASGSLLTSKDIVVDTPPTVESSAQSPRERHEAAIRAEVQASLAAEKEKASKADGGHYNKGMKKGEGLTGVFERLEGTQRRILAQNKHEEWNPESTVYPGLTINEIAEMKIKMLKEEMNRPKEEAIKASVAAINPEYLNPKYMAP